MKKLTKSQAVQEMFKEEKFPQLYSERGFEKSRLKCIIPIERDKLAYFVITKTGEQICIAP